MEIKYGRASAGDYDEAIDFINYVFSHAGSGTDFPALLPKLYRRDCFVPEQHYIVKEDGRIKSLIGAYPMVYRVLGEVLKIYGIGAVSVHPYARSKGYMKQLMDTIQHDMRAEGMVFGCLGGQRQRYEYFGYAQCGTTLNFRCTATNVRHAYGPDFAPGVRFEEITSNDSDRLDTVYALHTRKKLRIERSRERFLAVMNSWKNRLFGIWRSGALIGYIGASSNLGEICEAVMGDMDGAANAITETSWTEIVAAFITQFQLREVRVKLSAYETEKNAALAQLAENAEIGNAYQFNILDYPAVLSAFLRLQSETHRLPDGQAVIRILDRGTVSIVVRDNRPVVSATDAPPDLTLTHLNAAKLFFSPLSAYTPLSAYASESAPDQPSDLPPWDGFLRALLPLPLGMEDNDRV